MATETITIPLSGSKLKGSDWVADKDDTQYVTLTDGGNLSEIEIVKFGKGTPTESGDGPGGDDEFHIDLSGFNDDFEIEIKSMDAGDTFYIAGALSWSNDGNEYTINYIGSDGLLHELEIDVESQNGTGIAAIEITCFAAGTMIDTVDGQVPVEDLKPGDPVLCSDGTARCHRCTGPDRRVSDPQPGPGHQRCQSSYRRRNM